ncbi:hypothetical protein SAMN04488513_102892 [Pseudozobellia thermophila]|uniref:STAS/SEC14 domain-containing protein n=2 Tax=Pseudozobellia thermophila TaxID=192903 RepID=A0A1M6GPV9_9FLAO|nr:hypothetical protein SAMN04488513_102892 [Pseudozobellia thermophila]
MLRSTFAPNTIIFIGMNVRRPKKTVIVREYQLDVGKVQVYENYMVALFDEGATLTLERMYQIIGISEIHFRNKNFGYISLRKNSFAVDPTIYTYLRQLENLKAFAIVSVKEIDMHNFKIEKLFYKKPMKFFIEFDNALKWVKRRVKA